MKKGEGKTTTSRNKPYLSKATLKNHGGRENVD